MITIDQLKNYLGTGLKLLPDAKSAAYQNVLIGIYQDPCLSCDCVYFGTIDGQDMRTIQEMKPICYRLSDLDKLIPDLGFVPLDELYFEVGHSRDVSTQKSRSMYTWKKSMMTNIEMLTHYELDFWILSKLFKWHFWPFGEEYFDQGLVIDKLIN